MSVDPANNCAQKTHLANLPYNKPTTTQQANLFSTQLDTNTTNNKLQKAADHSGISVLSKTHNQGQALHFTFSGSLFKTFHCSAHSRITFSPDRTNLCEGE